MLDARPDVIVHQLTALSGQVGDLKHFDESFAATNALRTRGTDHLLAAAAEAGVGRFIAQSYAGWPSERTGGPVKTEEDPFDPNPTKESRETLAAIRYVEQRRRMPAGSRSATAHCTGRATPSGAAARSSRWSRRGSFRSSAEAPVCGRSATSTTRHPPPPLAVTRGAPGLYNIVDDDPAPVSEWLPELARIIGAKAPMHVPAWVAMPLIGEHGVSMMTQVRGSSNAKAKRELGWEPAWPSWREGFRTGLG